MDATPWCVVRLSSRTLWLPRSAVDRPSLDAGDVRAVGAAETAWEPGAVVPTGTWRHLKVRTSSVTTEWFRADRDVALVPLPPSARGWSPERQVESLGAVDRHFGVLEDVPGRATLTVDPGSERLLGLHLDNWDRLPASWRHASRNRANVNLGPVDRAFLFVDLDVTAGHAPEAVPDTRSVRSRLRSLPSPPALLRLLVPVGWAYIAPTENLLHDGASLDPLEAARHVSALGRFAPIASPAVVTVATAAT